MSVSLMENNSAEMRVVTGDKLVLRVAVYDPNGIGKIFIQCFQFSMGSSSSHLLHPRHQILQQLLQPSYHGLRSIRVGGSRRDR